VSEKLPHRNGDPQQPELPFFNIYSCILGTPAFYQHLHKMYRFSIKAELIVGRQLNLLTAIAMQAPRGRVPTHF
jgi:hypothetical protein